MSGKRVPPLQGARKGLCKGGLFIICSYLCEKGRMSDALLLDLFGQLV